MKRMGKLVLAVGLVVAGTAASAEAGLFGRKTVVVTGPSYVVATPPVYAAPVTTTTAVYTANPVVAAPVQAVYSAPAVVAAPVQTTVYSASAVVAAPVRTTYVAPRRLVVRRPRYVAAPAVLIGP